MTNDEYAIAPKTELLKKALNAYFWELDLGSGEFFCDGCESQNSSKEFSFEDWLSQIDEKDRDFVKNLILSCADSGEEIGVEFDIDAKGGKRRARLNAKRLQNGRSKIAALCVDVTEQIETKLALKNAEIALKAERGLFMGGPAVVFKWSAEEGWPILYVSANVSDMLYASADSLMADSALFSRLIHPDDIAVISAEVASYIGSKVKSFDQEYRLLRADGSYGWFHDYTVVEYDADENASFINGYLIDITAKKQAEETIRLRERQLSAIVDNLPVGVFFVTKEEGVVLSNKAGKRIWGEFYDVKPSDFEMYKARFLDGARVKATDWGAYKSLFLGESTINRKLAITTFQGEERVILESSVPIADDKGGIGGAIVINEDVTERDAYEKELKEAKETAESANRLKSEFLANISHEIRTPLNAVLGFAELLKNEPLDDRAKSFLNGIAVSGRNLLTLINDILDLSKIEAGKMAITPEPTDFKRLLQELKIVFDMKAEDKGIKYELAFFGELPGALMLDEARIRQILFNLLGNAIKFTKQGGVRLNVVSSKSQTKEGCFDLTVEVSDTGIGIPKGQMESIFEPFKQMDGQSARKYGGTGLGLSISKKLADIMGAKITVKSEVSKGSVFTLELFGVESCESCVDLGRETSAESSYVEGQERCGEVCLLDKEQKATVRALLQKEWLKANRLKSNDEIEEFAKIAQKRAEEIDSKALKQYADKLLEACEGFKASLIRKLFEEFETLIKE